jgi:signal transduction histidine kinase
MTSPDIAAAIESHAIPQWIEDTSTDEIVAVNGAARALLGVDRLAPGTSSSQWFTDDVRRGADRETGWIPGITLLRTATGSRHPVRLFTCLVTISSGEGRLVVLLPPEQRDGDISAVDAALEASERQFRNMAANVPGALFQYVEQSDGSNRVTYMSPRCLDLWEVPAEAIQADASLLWQMVHPDDLPGMAASVAESGRSLSRWSFEFRITTPSGILKWLQASGHPRRVDPDTMAWDSFILDVTDRRRAEEEQRLLRAQLRNAQQLEAIGRLAGGLAHDVNNMLTVVMGFAESALLSLPGDSPARLDLAEILSAAGSSAGLTRRLLAFARQQPATLMVVDLAERLEDSAVLLQRLTGGTVTIDFALGADVPPVEIDPSQFDQIVTNLVINARDAMPNGGAITLSLRRDGDQVLLEVADTGIGMDEATVARIYEPFFSTKGDGQGTGLGLATVFGIVAERGGTIAVQSSPGAGTTFTIRLSAALGRTPVAAVSEPDLLELPEQVLLCEDDPQLRRVLEQQLIRRGVKVRSAATPDEAIALAEAQAPQLLITDVVTGGRGGVALAAALREMIPTLPVVFMTGYVADELARRAIDSGSDEILRKPFRGADLIRALGRAWAVRQR